MRKTGTRTHLFSTCTYAGCCCLNKFDHASSKLYGVAAAAASWHWVTLACGRICLNNYYSQSDWTIYTISSSLVYHEPHRDLTDASLLQHDHKQLYSAKDGRTDGPMGRKKVALSYSQLTFFRWCRWCWCWLTTRTCQSSTFRTPQTQPASLSKPAWTRPWDLQQLIYGQYNLVVNRSKLAVAM